MTMAGFSDKVEMLLKQKGQPAIVAVPEMSYIMVGGKGSPSEGAEYPQAIEALYGLAYTAKFAIKKARKEEFKVGPLETLWWNTSTGSLALGKKEDWQWQAMIMLPDLLTRADFDLAVRDLKTKKDPPALNKARFERWEEGLCAQVLHVGPYSEEGPTIERLHRFIEEQGYVMHGKHHEIYLGDPRRAAPEKLRTIVRHPIRR